MFMFDVHILCNQFIFNVKQTFMCPSSGEYLQYQILWQVIKTVAGKNCVWIPATQILGSLKRIEKTMIWDESIHDIGYNLYLQKSGVCHTMIGDDKYSWQLILWSFNVSLNQEIYP